MLNRGASLAIVGRVGALLLGGAFLWQVAERVGPTRCEAVVHVPESNVDVMIDSSAYRIGEVRDEPIVCELTPGEHHLAMYRSGQLLFEQGFSVKPGEDVVLTAWDQNRAMDLAPEDTRIASTMPEVDAFQAGHSERWLRSRRSAP
ncbi:hypothetical protein [Singulisphaera sp. PoT]|uniref:hypothetical protein n=1 Tax=Singulisphaera sp. PoT TaxID=3411797 RepID=UPI003BF56593